jgi:hypothetical protein
MSLLDIAYSKGEASDTAKRIGFPCLIIPWGIGNLILSDFVCHQESEVEALWNSHMDNIQTPSFCKVHVLKAYGWIPTTNPK